MPGLKGGRYIEENENLLDLYPDLRGTLEWLDNKDAELAYLRQRVAELESTLQTIALEERVDEEAEQHEQSD